MIPSIQTREFYLIRLFPLGTRNLFMTLTYKLPSRVPWPRPTAAQIGWVAHNIQLVSHGFSSTVTLAIGPGKELYPVRHLRAGGKETHLREGGQLRRRF